MENLKVFYHFVIENFIFILIKNYFLKNYFYPLVLFSFCITQHHLHFDGQHFFFTFLKFIIAVLAVPGDEKPN